MTWLYEHTEVVSAVAAVGLLAVWIAYAQLFYKRYRRQRRPRIIIDQMSRQGPGSMCVLTNLSAEVIYLECVLAVAVTEDGEYSVGVTEQEIVSSSEESARKLVSRMRQGPIGVGELIAVGTLEELARRALGSASAADGAVQAVRHLDVRVVATMGSEDDPVGASKRFRLGFGDPATSRPTNIGTTQMYSRREKRRVLEWIGEA